MFSATRRKQRARAAVSLVSVADPNSLIAAARSVVVGVTLAFMKSVSTNCDGDIVVALVNGSDATLKRFYRDGENIRLQPSNVTMQPIIVPAASVEIQGRVIGVLRKY